MAAAKKWSWENKEEEEVEAEQLVLTELSGIIIDSDFLSNCENKCKILETDTERPILQVDSCVYAGEDEDTVGTCVIFEEIVEHVDAEGNDKTMLTSKCHTTKELNMTRSHRRGDGRRRKQVIWNGCKSKITISPIASTQFVAFYMKMKMRKLKLPLHMYLRNGMNKRFK